MQSPTDSSDLSHISPAQRYEEEIEIYSGDDPLSVWESYINWMSNSDPAACFKLTTRCINEFKKEKRYHDDWRFIRICIHRVRSCKDKVLACRRLHDLGIGNREGLFYKAWADFCESQGEIEEAKLVYDRGFDRSNSNVDMLKVSHNQFVKKNCQRKKLQRMPQKEECVPKEVSKVQIILGSKSIEDFKQHCPEEFMAEEWFAGKRKSQRLTQKPDFREMRKKSTFGSALENIREEAESYQTMNSTLSPVKKLRSFRDESVNEEAASSTVSENIVSSDMPMPVNSVRQVDGLVNTYLQQQDLDENGVSDDDYEDDMTKHSKYAKTYLEGLFFGTSEPDKSTHNLCEGEKNDKPFSIYADSFPQPVEVRPFTIYEDSGTTSNEEDIQRTPEVNAREDVEMKENVDVVETENLVTEQDYYKAADEQVEANAVQENKEIMEDNDLQEDASFLSSSIINIHSQADKSVANFQEFSKGLKPGKTSTQNVTDVFKSLAKSIGVKKFVRALDESVDRSKESFRREHEEGGNPCISLCDYHVNKKHETPIRLEDVDAPHSLSEDHSSYREVEKSAPNDSMKRYIEEYKFDETLTGKPNDMAIDDDDGSSLVTVHNSQLQLGIAGTQDFNKDLQPEKAQNVREMFQTKVSNSHNFIAAYEAPVSDQSDEEMIIAKSNSRWRRCSVSSIVPPLVTKLSDSTLDEVDFNLSSGAESRLNRDNNKEEEFATGMFAASFTDTSILIDTDNPYNEESIQSFISHLNPPLSKYPGYQEIKHQRMPAFKVGSNITLGMNNFIVKKILGAGAYAKAYHLSYVGLENKEDCVVKLQRPSCPWEFYIARELRKRLQELIEEQFINVIPSVMHITEAYFFDDGSLFLNEMHNYGTLLDLINLQKCKMIELPQWFVLMLCYELVCVVDAMHRCSMIHGDLKPDNVLLRQLPLLKDEDSVVCLLKTKTSFLKLIDFGQSIDMAMYPRRTEFTSKSKKKDFQCTEMKMGKSWSYHIDLYFLAGLMYVLMMGIYMNPSVIPTNKWSAHVKLKRSWKHEERIKEFIDMLINIESADKMPDLSIISAWLLSAIDVKTDTYNAFIKQLASILNK